MYFISFCEQDIREALLSIDGVTSYEYFDNIDKPKDISAEEWDERRDVWDRILGYDPPIMRGLSWGLRELAYLPSLGDRDALMATMPDIPTRARNIAVRRALADVGLPPEGLTSEYIGELFTTKLDVLADEEALKRIEDSLSEITFDDLVSPI